eukprot:CAMPEP_0180481878 /NCGR_PEP_ID=MMETSP1036_2-20121128/34594_1 /TAXON_ID=632150 /ORGANISM="Azadinium spinosum, Strain 3D9" /LENGTH=85 /DNA_ID=CAMNT_0022489589 /DNA_START=339 /DNA_END=592 /DNA_ORIENTATION=+
MTSGSVIVDFLGLDKGSSHARLEPKLPSAPFEDNTSTPEGGDITFSKRPSIVEEESAPHSSADGLLRRPIKSLLGEAFSFPGNGG